MKNLSAISPAKLREGTTVDDMLSILADEIISGGIAPGTKLDARVIAERFAVSRTPYARCLVILRRWGWLTSALIVA